MNCLSSNFNYCLEKIKYGYSLLKSKDYLCVENDTVVTKRLNGIQRVFRLIGWKYQDTLRERAAADVFRCALEIDGTLPEENREVAKAFLRRQGHFSTKGFHPFEDKEKKTRYIPIEITLKPALEPGFRGRYNPDFWGPVSHGGLASEVIIAWGNPYSSSSAEVNSIKLKKKWNGSFCLKSKKFSKLKLNEDNAWQSTIVHVIKKFIDSIGRDLRQDGEDNPNIYFSVDVENLPQETYEMWGLEEVKEEVVSGGQRKFKLINPQSSDLTNDFHLGLMFGYEKRVLSHTKRAKH